MGTVKVVGILPEAVLSRNGALMGQECVLTLKNFSAARSGPFGHLEPETYELKGVVMPRPRGHEDEFNMFGFAVAFSEVPMRVVAIHHVVAINGTPLIQPPTTKGKTKEPEVKTWKIKSSRGDEVYTVTLKNNVYSCTCVANSNFRRVCRHIKEAKDGKA